LSATISALHFVIPSAFYFLFPGLFTAYFLFTAFESLKTQGGTPVRPIQCSLDVLQYQKYRTEYLDTEYLDTEC
jgi:hypothetical protein